MDRNSTDRRDSSNDGRKPPVIDARSNRSLPASQETAKPPLVNEPLVSESSTLEAQVADPVTRHSTSVENENDSPVIASLSPPVIRDEEIVVTEMLEDAAESSANARRSWPFKFANGMAFLLQRSFGIASMIFLLAIVASIPVVQFLSLGYLFEVKRRISQSGKLRAGMFGLDRAARIGSLLLGAWLWLWPVRIVSNLWYEAYLIDPGSPQTQFMRGLQIVAIILVVSHILAAWFCGGKLRYFFWPLVAPFSFAIWALRSTVNSNAIRPSLQKVTGWISPNLVNDLCNVRPVTDWFLPAILFKNLRNGTLYSNARDGVWDFVMGLRLDYFFLLGLRGFIGTVAWLVIPTALLATATILTDAAAVLVGLLGIATATFVFTLLPFIQVHFAHENRNRSFCEVLKVFRIFRAAPLAHWIALFFMFLFALPLFLLKIEPPPPELMWTLSIVFIVFTWPAHCLVAWAYGRGIRKEKLGWKIFRYPIVLSTPIIAFLFTFLFFFTRYTSWNGALSMFEHHAFLFPVPFWIN